MRNWADAIDLLCKLLSIPGLIVTSAAYQQSGDNVWLFGLGMWVWHCAYYFPVFKTKGKK